MTYAWSQWCNLQDLVPNFCSGPGRGFRNPKLQSLETKLLEADGPSEIGQSL